MNNGLYNGLDNGLFNGLYSNDIGARLKDPIINLDAGDRRSASSNIVTKWIDLTYNNYNGILINGASFNSSNQGCISCNGGSAYVEIENSDKIKLGAENFSVEYWVKKKVTTVGAGYIGVWGVNKWVTGGASPGQNEWSLALGDANVDQFQFNVEVGATTYGTGVYPLTINQWYQAVGIRKGEKLQLYVNGILRQEYTHPFFNQNSIINHSGKKIRIHNSYLDSFHANADVAILKFYKKALSKEEVRDNFNNLRGRFGI
jgi:hypothetical protein